MSDDLTLSQAWLKLQALGDRKPACSIAQANVQGFFDFLSKEDVWYRISSRNGKFSIGRMVSDETG